MVVVDIVISSLDKTYSFNLDENTQIGAVMEEIVEMVCQKEQCKISGDTSRLILCTIDKQAVLNRKMTLRASGVVSGNKLFLV